MISYDESLLRDNYNKLEKNLFIVKNKIISELKDNLSTVEFIDGIYGRVKAKESFIKKVLNQPDKYKNPFLDVEDLIGIRILVLFPEISKVVSEIISTKIFSPLELEYKCQATTNSFGYEGYQSIHSIPVGLIPENTEVELPGVFELQVRTLFQHAWAESEHEINYKRCFKFPDNEETQYKKSFAWIAASSWGADKILEDLFQKYNKSK